MTETFLMPGEHKQNPSILMNSDYKGVEYLLSHVVNFVFANAMILFMEGPLSQTIESNAL